MHKFINKSETWNALSGQLWKNFAIGPAFPASGDRRETVGAGRKTSMKSAIMAIT
jgi:hypothetical protein